MHILSPRPFRCAPRSLPQISRAMAPTVRLTYFAGYGLAEQIRWMLAATETSFEQVPGGALENPTGAEASTEGSSGAVAMDFFCYSCDGEKYG